MTLTGRAVIVRSLLAVLCCACAARAQEWSRFEWSRQNYSGRTFEKAALMLPVRLEGVDGTYYMQLDTGLNLTVLYGTPYEEVLRRHNAFAPEKLGGAPSPQGYARAALSARVGRLVLKDAPVVVRKDYGGSVKNQGRPKIGSVGLDLFAERVLLLDFPARRFAILDKGEPVPADIERRASFFPVTERNGKLFVTVSHGDDPLGELFYDTGASAFTLLPPAVWRRVTGREGPEPDNVRVAVPSWGRSFTAVGAPSLKPLRVGTFDAGRQTVYFAESPLPNVDFEHYPFKVGGLVGNAPFYDAHAVIIDLPRRRMGVMPGGKTGGS